MISLPDKLDRLTKANIYKHNINDYDLLRYYVSEFKGFNKDIKSNIRQGDKNKSLCFKVGYNGRAVISDFGMRTGMSVWDYLGIYLRYGEDSHGYMCLLDRVRQDFNLPLEPYSKISAHRGKINGRKPIRHNKQLEPSEEWVFHCTYRKYNAKQDKAYWFNKYGLKAIDLLKRNIFALERYSRTKGTYTEHFIPQDEHPHYAYVPDKSLGYPAGRCKIYRPTLPKNKRWLNNLTQDMILGLHLLPPTGHTLIIETSYKDEACNAKIFEKEDIWFISLFSESVFFTNDLMQDLRRRFKYIFYHADNDEPGIRMALKHFEEQPLLDGWFSNPMDQPALKDSADMREAWGETRTKDFLLNTIYSLWQLIQNISQELLSLSRCFT